MSEVFPISCGFFFCFFFNLSVQCLGSVNRFSEATNSFLTV